MILSLYFSFGISDFSGVYKAKSEPLPLKSYWVKGLKLKHNTESAWLNLSMGYIFFSDIALNFQTTHDLSLEPVANILPSFAKAIQLMVSLAE